jgi:sulfate permease, SulP family
VIVGIVALPLAIAFAIASGVTPDRGLYMRRMAEVAGVSLSVQIYEINGPLFFGAAAAFKQALGDIAKRPRVIILRMGRVPAIDATGRS